MPTEELSRPLIQPLTEEQELVAHAAAIILDRIRRLPEEDAKELFDLLTDLLQARTDEERQAARGGIMEILNQRPVQVRMLDLSHGLDANSHGLRSWLEWVAKRLRDLRTAAKLTQEELAQKSGLPQSHISRIENAKHSPSRATLEKLAHALKVPLHEFDPSE
jgi:DNA-binding XRE family transcriptional regulator